MSKTSLNAKCGIELKALVPFKIFLPMNWDILGPFSSTSGPNEINILKLEQLSHHLTICIYKENLIGTRRKVKHLLSIFLAAGLADVSSVSLNFSNDSNTEKQMQLYPKMASRLGQHLLIEKSKAENFGLFALYSSYFFICCLTAPWPTFSCYRANSLTQSMLIIVFGRSVFSLELKWERLGL